MLIPTRQNPNKTPETFSRVTKVGLQELNLKKRKQCLSEKFHCMNWYRIITLENSIAKV